MADTERFPQTRGALCRTTPYLGTSGAVSPPGYCCLGVLCEQAVAAGIAERVLHPSGDGRVGYRRAGSSDPPAYNVLPLAVAAWAGLDDEVDPIVTARPSGMQTDGSYSLSSLNDQHRFTFVDIMPLVARL